MAGWQVSGWRSGASLGLFLAVLSLFCAHAAEANRIRGITISTHTDGREWGTEAMKPTLAKVRELGANWVAVHPYATVKADGSIRPWRVDSSPGIHDYVARAIADSHRQGLKILVKPHLAYWGSPFSWRGEISFTTPAQWRRFFRAYQEWILPLAEASEQADAFAIGTELDATLDHEDAWRHLIEAVRDRVHMPLTYAANWSDYQRVPFWDALDAIGIQGYFPLTKSTAPREDELEAAWKGLTRELRDYSLRWDRYVVLTELGYSRAHSAASRPWEHRNDGPEAQALQLTCLRIALEAVEREPRLVGAFLWKWFPEPYPMGRNFRLAAPAMRDTIEEAWIR